VGLRRKLARLKLLAAIALTAGCGGFVYHRVLPGETLYSISWRYGLDYRDVAEWNHIRAPYTIYDGQLLRVMPPSGPGRKAASVPPSLHGAPVINAPEASASVIRHPQSSSAPAAIKWHWPVRGRLIHTFSGSDLGRKGIDIGGKAGEPIRAAAAGSVVYAGSGLLNYGKLIILKHDDNYLSAYAYNRTLLVKEGETVTAGQHIADMGNKTNGDAMLHFEIRYDGRPINPMKYLPQARQ
jgi:lipoprotein NlpD